MLMDEKKNSSQNVKSIHSSIVAKPGKFYLFISRHYLETRCPNFEIKFPGNIFFRKKNLHRNGMLYFREFQICHFLAKKKKKIWETTGQTNQQPGPALKNVNVKMVE